jgi:hypothetical protein
VVWSVLVSRIQTPAITRSLSITNRWYDARTAYIRLGTIVSAVRTMAVGSSIHGLLLRDSMFKTLNFDSSYWFVVSRLSLVQLKMPFWTPWQHLLSSIKTETGSGIPSLTGQDENQVISQIV